MVAVAVTKMSCTEQTANPVAKSSSSLPPVVPSDVQTTWRSRGKKWSLSRPYGSTVALSLLMVGLLLSGRQYLHGILAFLSALPWWQSSALLQVLFILVSFPFTFGYLLLNIASGYLYGFVGGVLAASTCAGVGVLVSLSACRRWFRDTVHESLEQSHLKALIRVMDGSYGFRVVMLTRLTPIPFGLQNACFAVTDQPVWRCCLASIIGLLPAQSFNAYLGSTVRNMEELYTRQWDSYLLVVFQFLGLCTMLAYVLHLARLELKAAEYNLPTHSRSTGKATEAKKSSTDSPDSSSKAEFPAAVRSSRHSRSWSHPVIIQFV
ncbi:transmembrane protein 64-like [Sycon ciliatum]|uniref:transmembrane protein 64-like n=1 Tax=Sycon ciliatum TaxID=27933 RepID=UPI0020AB1216|eukprot:scpid77651/ scgid7391/ Transmembrane protein 64